jgi:dipeptidyl aminopeptidase/acylaminoacyl peptidase
MNRETSPTGTVAPFSLQDLATEIRFGELAWDSDGRSLVWLEGRSERSVLVAADLTRGARRDLNRDWPVRAQVGYGGGDFTVSRGVLYFVSGTKLYRKGLNELGPRKVADHGVPLCSPVVSPDGRWVLVVASGPERDSLCIVSAEGGVPAVLYQDAHFCMQPAWHPNGGRVIWVAWNHPHMPWERSRVMVAELDAEGTQPQVLRILPVPAEANRSAGVFQPTFSPDGRYIAFVSDRSGWFNLHLFGDDFRPVAHLEDLAEHAPPAWLQSMRSHAWAPDGSRLFYLRSSQGFATLESYDPASGRRRTTRGDLSRYSFLSQLQASPQGDEVALVGSSPRISPRVLRVRPRSGRVAVVQRGTPELYDASALSQPNRVAWNLRGRRCFGLYFPPGAGSASPPPAMIKVHGGPTSQYHAAWDPDTQFFTSRGYAVLALNYRGSSGYGRRYRRMLAGKWGVADVEDLLEAADILEREGVADPGRLVLSGGSAGGLTVLLSLIRSPGRFRAAIVRYGLTDLRAAARETHRFERHYLDWLVGPLPDAASRYDERSPLNHADRIRDPVALFQGDADRVVPRSQSDRIAESLRTRGVPHLYKVFLEEGHGWRKGETIAEYYRLVEEFLRLHVMPGE